ncbi:MAG TPA: VOC family protein [Polyangiaceae bacterium]|jgi:predicted enzyme related to lactoylglutathione lyase|nr:VOC family protein [Polyangiaceae bacterium]
MLDVLVNIDVEELGAATRFYTEAFELRVGRRFGEGAVELLGARVPLYLLCKPAGTLPAQAATGTRSYRRHWTPVHLDFVVKDIDAALARAEAAGATREGQVSEHAWGKLALLADPWGNGFCLLEFVGRGYDELADQPGADVRLEE